MNIDENFNKILTNQIQQYIERIIHRNKWDFSQGYKDFSISANQSV